MPHFVTSYMNQNKSCKQTLESVQYWLEISFKQQIEIIYKLENTICEQISLIGRCTWQGYL